MPTAHEKYLAEVAERLTRATEVMAASFDLLAKAATRMAESVDEDIRAHLDRVAERVLAPPTEDEAQPETAQADEPPTCPNFWMPGDIVKALFTWTRGDVHWTSGAGSHIEYLTDEEIDAWLARPHRPARIVHLVERVPESSTEDEEPTTWKFKTALGCTVRTRPAPENLGEGILLTLRMDDGREAEVYLDQKDMESLKTAIGMMQS